MNLLLVFMVVVLAGQDQDDVAFRNVASDRLEKAFADLVDDADSISFVVTLGGVEYRPRGSVAAQEELVDLLPDDCLLGDLSDVAKEDDLVAGGGYGYRLHAVHSSGGVKLKVYDSDGSWVWGWVSKDGVAYESCRGQLAVAHELPPGNLSGRNVPLAYANSIFSCSVLSYRPSFYEEDCKIRKWFVRQLRKSVPGMSKKAGIEVWVRERHRQLDDGSTWERTDAIGLDEKSGLPVAWDSREMSRSAEGAVTSVVCKTRRFEW